MPISPNVWTVATYRTLTRLTAGFRVQELVNIKPEDITMIAQG